ncbi:Putative peroxiredoxin bcp [Fuerstiella marisgermanici]|uniref:Peroxiredoxin bcp n=2 Tax=Fuerstiella marisgermanici TaxID=1891926 RepID=A0A1P8WAE5_9PLAN|nr:Putative peroxiredoxin bcp [Fuerstiella marisgermanici]
MAQAELKVGDDAPAFELKGSDGKTYKLADFKGKSAVVVAWFPKAFTGGCTKECKSFRENGEAIREFQVKYFTASCDTVEKNTAFAKSLELDYPILSDPEKKVAEAYGVVHEGRAVPERWTYFIGMDGKILHIDKKVKTASHGEDIAAQLKELEVPQKKG